MGSGVGSESEAGTETKNGVGGRNGDMNGDRDGDGAGTRTGVEANEGTQNGNRGWKRGRGGNGNEDEGGDPWTNT